MNSKLSREEKILSCLYSDLSENDLKKILTKAERFERKFRDWALEEGIALTDLVDFYRVTYIRSFMSLIFTMDLARGDFRELKLEMLSEMDSEMSKLYNTFVLKELKNATKQ